MSQGKNSATRVVEEPILEPAAIHPVDEIVLPAPVRTWIEWSEVLWAQRRFLLRYTLAGVLFATIVAFLIPKRYESTARIMPPDSQSSPGLGVFAALAAKGNVGGLGLSSMAGDLLGLKSPSAIFTDVLRSRTVRDRLIERFDLRRVYWDRYWEDARQDLARHTTITEDRKSSVITVTVTDHDPHRASQMAQAYVEELDHVVTTVATSSARRERIFIEQRLIDVKLALDDASRDFSKYASENATVDITAQAKATVEAAARLEGTLVAAQAELEGLEQIYTPSNIRVRAMQARVGELKRERAKIRGTSAPADDTASEQDFPSVGRLPLVGLRWVDLYRQAQIQETVYELLTRQYEMAKIQEAKEIPTVKILDPADLPEKKSFPPRGLLIVFGTVLSLSLAATWVVVKTSWIEIDPHDRRKQLALEIVETVRRNLSQWLWRRNILKTKRGS